MPVVVGNAGSDLIAQIVCKGTLASAGSTSKPIYSIFYYQRAAGAGTISKSALNAAFAGGPFAAMLAAFNIGYGSASNDIRWLDDALNAVNTFTLVGSGAIATDRAPSYASVYMNLKTGVRGKPYRGSKHFAAVNEIDTTGDVLTGAGLARWQAVQTAIIAPLTDANGIVWTPCIITRKYSQLVVNPTSVMYNNITQVVLDLTLGTMKRRKVRTVV